MLSRFMLHDVITDNEHKPHSQLELGITNKKRIAREYFSMKSNKQTQTTKHEIRQGVYVSRVCACAKRTGAAARKSLRRDHPGGLTGKSPAFHACGSASPLTHAIVTVAKNRTSASPKLSFAPIPHASASRAKLTRRRTTDQEARKTEF